MSLYAYHHRKRINTEEKAKVVAAAWGTDLLQFLAALAFLHLDDLKKDSSWCKIDSAARHYINSVHQPAATTFVFSFVCILLLCSYHVLGEAQADLLHQLLRVSQRPVRFGQQLGLHEAFEAALEAAIALAAPIRPL